MQRPTLTASKVASFHPRTVSSLYPPDFGRPGSPGGLGILFPMSSSPVSFCESSPPTSNLIPFGLGPGDLLNLVVGVGVLWRLEAKGANRDDGNPLAGVCDRLRAWLAAWVGGGGRVKGKNDSDRSGVFSRNRFFSFRIPNSILRDIIGAGGSCRGANSIRLEMSGW